MLRAKCRTWDLIAPLAWTWSIVVRTWTSNCKLDANALVTWLLDLRSSRELSKNFDFNLPNHKYEKNLATGNGQRHAVTKKINIITIVKTSLYLKFQAWRKQEMQNRTEKIHTDEHGLGLCHAQTTRQNRTKWKFVQMDRSFLASLSRTNQWQFRIRLKKLFLAGFIPTNRFGKFRDYPVKDTSILCRT